MIKKYPKILVISNNAFSQTRNNGKTLASFFNEIPANMVAQLYFFNENPDSNKFKNYYRITDIEMLKSLFIKDKPGRKIFNKKIELNTDNKNRINFINKYNIFRIVREMVWKLGKWNTSELNEWLDEFNPEVIFFCAGDSIFAYKIVEYIKKKYKTKVVVYITDDYVLKRKTISPFWWVRRNYIHKEMLKTVQASDLFITISSEMKSTYKKIFNKDSIIAMNMSDSMLDGRLVTTMREKENIRLVYTGGLNFNRYKTLRILGKTIEKFNKNSVDKKVYLEIYSGIDPGEKIIKKLDIINASKYCGSLDATSLKMVLNNSDILVHVESFSNNSIESTRLSISTKISEYLSLSKPILAVGPPGIASMKYLSDSAFCITDLKKIDSEFERFINDKEMQSNISIAAGTMYQNNHTNRELISDLLIKMTK